MRWLDARPWVPDEDDGLDLEATVADWVARQPSATALANAALLGALLLAIVLFAVIHSAQV